MLQTALGLKLEFLGDPSQKFNFYIPHFSKEDESAISLEIQKLVAKGVITKFEHDTGEYISPIFIRKKTDSSCRLILNLKNLNEDVSYIHFKRNFSSQFSHSLLQDVIWHHWTRKMPVTLYLYTQIMPSF